MYRCKSISELLTWHSTNKSSDGLVRHVPDSQAWAHIDRTWPEFGNDPRLGLSLDGVNPFSDKSTIWSTWPVLVINYNLPPWLATKSFFMMLTLLIPGKQSVKSTKVDVLIAPLVEELQVLWEGVLAIDTLQAGPVHS